MLKLLVPTDSPWACLGTVMTKLHSTLGLGQNLGSDRRLRGQGGKSNAGALRVPDVGERASVADRERMRDRCWQVKFRHLVPAMLVPCEWQAACIALHASSTGDIWLRQGRLSAGGDLLSIKLGKTNPVSMVRHARVPEVAAPCFTST